MRHEQLQNHIKGSILKEQYLEAFLVQSAYIESLLKLFLDFNYWVKMIYSKFKEGKPIDPMVQEIQNKINKYGLFDMIEFLYKSRLIDHTFKTDLHNYREKRNNIMHDLLKNLSDDNFEKELEQACKLGAQIIESTQLKNMREFIDDQEKAKEAQEDAQSTTATIPT